MIFFIILGMLNDIKKKKKNTSCSAFIDDNELNRTVRLRENAYQSFFCVIDSYSRSGIDLLVLKFDLQLESI